MHTPQYITDATNVHNFIEEKKLIHFREKSFTA